LRNKTTAALLALLLGGIGAHKFYLGRGGLGILYLIFCWTFIPAVIGFIEAIMLFSMSDADFDLKYNTAFVSARAVAPQNIIVNVANTAHVGAPAMAPVPDVRVADPARMFCGYCGTRGESGAACMTCGAALS
jgi:TM2 domain-containing membrane protein YozV